MALVVLENPRETLKTPLHPQTLTGAHYEPVESLDLIFFRNEAHECVTVKVRDIER